MVDWYCDGVEGEGVSERRWASLKEHVRTRVSVLVLPLI